MLKTVLNNCKTHFKIDLSKAFGKRLPIGTVITTETMRELAFGNFMEPDAETKFYDEIDDWYKLEKIVVYYLNEYNAQAEVPIDLVLFKYAIEHIVRISRVIQMPREHVLAIGYGGMGRKTTVKLVASMAGADLFKFNITKNYSLTDWRHDIKRLLMSAGLKGKCTILLHGDSDMRNDAFMDDIVALMSYSELPNLFQTDEKAKIIDSMRTVVQQMVRVVISTIIIENIQIAFFCSIATRMWQSIQHLPHFTNFS